MNFLTKGIGNMVSAVKENVSERIWPSTSRIVHFAKGDDNADEVDFAHDQLEKALAGIENLPLLVVSVTGVFRSGKSFLLNLMVTYLKHLMSEGLAKDWKDSNMEITGMNWARDSKTVTHGIWIWNTPFVITAPSGTKVAVLLVDCQGTGDTSHSSPHLDTVIFYISLQLANFQIMNLVKQMTTNDIERIEICKEYAHASEKCAPLFGSLLYLIRDWEHDDEIGERTGHFQSLQEESASEHVKQSALGVQKAFREVRTFMLPPPSNNVRKGSEDKKLRVSESALDGEFLNAVNELFAAMFTKDGMENGLKTGKEVLFEMKGLDERIKTCGIKALSAAEAMDDSVAHNAMKRAKEIPRKAMDACRELIRSILPHKAVDSPVENVTRIMEEAWLEAVEQFNEDYGKSEESRKQSRAYNKFLLELEEGYKDGLRMILDDAKAAVSAKEHLESRDEEMRLKREEEKKVEEISRLSKLAEEKREIQEQMRKEAEDRWRILAEQKMKERDQQRAENEKRRMEEKVRREEDARKMMELAKKLKDEERKRFEDEKKREEEKIRLDIERKNMERQLRAEAEEKLEQARKKKEEEDIKREAQHWEEILREKEKREKERQEIEAERIRQEEQSRRLEAQHREHERLAEAHRIEIEEKANSSWWKKAAAVSVGIVGGAAAIVTAPISLPVAVITGVTAATAAVVGVAGASD